MICEWFEAGDGFSATFTSSSQDQSVRLKSEPLPWEARKFPQVLQENFESKSNTVLYKDLSYNNVCMWSLFFLQVINTIIRVPSYRNLTMSLFSAGYDYTDWECLTVFLQSGVKNYWHGRGLNPQP